LWVSELRIESFRNYRQLQARFGRGRVVVLGPNAHGKTNLMEALGVLALGVSHRDGPTRGLVQAGEQRARLEAVVERAGGAVRPAVEITARGQKAFSVGGAPCAHLGEYLGHLNALVFSAGDVALADGEPTMRRRHLNQEIAKRRPAYLAELSAYRRCLAQRNAALRSSRDGLAHASVTGAFTDSLVRHGELVLAERVAHVARVAPLAGEIHGRLSDGAESLRVAYRATADPGTLAAAIERSWRDDRARGMTLVGPHRDDVLLEVNGRNVRTAASRGQQKTCALALKLAEAYLDGTDPAVPLLDDVMSELDPLRRERLGEELTRFDQFMVTGTHDGDVAPGILRNADVRHVRSGTLIDA